MAFKEGGVRGGVILRIVCSLIWEEVGGKV